MKIKAFKGWLGLKTICMLLVVAFLMATPGFCSAQQSGPSHPFKPGEKFIFDLYWEFIPAGTAILEVLPMETVEGVLCNHFRATVHTNSVLDKIYKVRLRIDAYTDAKMTHSILYKKRSQEGKKRRDAHVRFDWDKSVSRSYFGQGERVVKIPPGTFDPLSLFYAFRLRSLSENTAVEIPVADGKKSTMGRAQILQREQIKVPAGVYDAFLVDADTKDVGGVFKKSEGAKLQVWVSSDPRHIPVKIKSRVAVGSFYADLVKVVE
jgi:hypothetical protein